MARPVVMLPQEDRSLALYELGAASPYEPPTAPLKSRVVYAAAHVVGDPFAEHGPGAPAALDWDATLAYRRYLWSMGLAVAEAMDTAQRGMGLDWFACRELIRRTAPTPTPRGAGSPALRPRTSCRPAGLASTRSSGPTTSSVRLSKRQARPWC
jgi:hypothetical protein